MPHIHSFVRRDVQQHVEFQYTTLDNFKTDLAQIVAWTFNDHAGESLEVGVHSLAYEPILTNSMPADIAVVITYWYNEKREQVRQRIEDLIKEAIVKQFPTLNVEVHFCVIGPVDDPLDFAKGTPNK